MNNLSSFKIHGHIHQMSRKRQVSVYTRQVSVYITLTCCLCVLFLSMKHEICQYYMWIWRLFCLGVVDLFRLEVIEYFLLQRLVICCSFIMSSHEMWRHTLVILSNVECPRNGSSDIQAPPPPPPLNSTWLFGLRNFSCQSLRCGGGGVSGARPPTTTPKLTDLTNIVMFRPPHPLKFSPKVSCCQFFFLFKVSEYISL